MEKLVLIAALAAVVTSLPSTGRNSYQLRLLGNEHEDKSLQLFHYPVEAARSNQDINTQHFKFNKELVNKKFGHLAHNPEDEVQIVSQEKCNKQKRKTCDLDTKKRVAKHVNEPNTEKKEMITDSDLHGQMEVARQALEHIQQNLGNLEAINIQATTLNDAESLQKARLAMANSNNGKMAYWEDYMEHINKNADEAKDAEDGLKSKSSKTEIPLIDFDLSKIAKESEANPIINESDRQVNVEANVPDMSPAATEHKEMEESHDIMTGQAKEATAKSDGFDTQGKSVDQFQVSSSESEKNQKSFEPETSPNAPLDLLAEKFSEAIEKSATLEQIEKSATLEDTNNLDDIIAQQHQQSSERMDLAPAPSQSVKSVAPFLDNNLNGHPSVNKLENNPVLEDQSVLEENDMKMLSKSSENNAEAMEIMPDQSMMMKNTEPMDTNSTTLMKNSELEQPVNFAKSSENKEFTDKNTKNESKEHLDEMSQMKSANLVVMDDKPMQAMNTVFQDVVPHMREAGPIEKQLHMDDSPLINDHTHQLSPHHHNHMPQFEDHHHMPMSHAFSDQLARGSQGKSVVEMTRGAADVMDSAVGKAAMEQWKAKEASAGRGAYGSAAGALIAGSGAGAVGMFPGARVGGCAIPLLLSCSPSVVHGSLASGPAYAAHAYRNTEDFEGSFLTKRHVNDIKLKVKRTPSYKNFQKILPNKL